jgi:chemotaxis signal transduction protein
MVPVEGGTEVATFYVEQQMMGMLASEVVECIEVAHVVRSPSIGGGKRHVGYTVRGTKTLPLMDLSGELGEQTHAQRHALVLRQGSTEYGLLVSSLGPVIDMHVYTTQQMVGLGGPTRLYSRVARAGDVLIPILSADNVLDVT